MSPVPTLADAHARPLEALEASLARIEALNGRLNAVLDLAPGARAEAEAAEARRRAGASLSELDGVPVLVKANIAVAGLPWHAGIGAYRNRVAAEDAQAVARLRAGGAVILGTLNMEEGALGAVTDNPHFGRCFNPWREGLTPGGSSGGSGAAAAAGFAPVTLGTDTMGSVRIPAAYCGVCGHKPSRGAVPVEGVIPLSHSLDHVGPLTRAAADLSPAFAVLSGLPVRTVESPLAGKRVGRWRFEIEMDVRLDVMRTFDAALALLREQGAQIVDLRLKRYGFGKSRREGLIISEWEGHGEHAVAMTENPQGFSDSFTKMLQWGARQGEARYREALRLLDASGLDAAEAFTKVDFIVAPTALEPAFRFGEPIPPSQADLTAFADFAGIPSTTVPMGLSAEGLPLGVQIMAPAGADFAGIAAATAFEAARGDFAQPRL